MYIGRLNIAMISVLHYLVYRLSAIPIKIPSGYFVDNDTPSIIKFIRRGRKVRGLAA